MKVNDTRKFQVINSSYYNKQAKHSQCFNLIQICYLPLTIQEEIHPDYLYLRE